MGFLSWVGLGNNDGKDDAKRNDERDKKIRAQQQEILAGLQTLNRALGRANDLRDVRMRNADRLIKEGSGR